MTPHSTITGSERSSAGNNPPRILQICNKAPFPANDGSSIAISSMTNGLLACGATVKLLTINTRKHFKADARVPAKIREQAGYVSVFRDTSPSIAGGLLNLVTGRSYFVSRFRFSAFRKALTEILKQNTFDIVQLEGLFMCSYIPVIRRYSNARIVLRAHNVEHLIWERHLRHEKSALRKWYLGLQTRRLKSFESRSLREIDGLVPITLSDEQVFRQMGYRGPAHTCITGISPDDYPAADRSSEKPMTVFYIGSMDWLPNREAVLWFIDNCWNRVLSQMPEARLVIGGRGMPLQLFHMNRPDLQIVEHVEEAAAFFRAHQVMIVPLLSGSGLRIKIIEGMAHGKAIISTTIGAEGIGYTDGVNIVIADDAERFSAAVVDLLRDRDKRVAIGTHARGFALKEFNNTTVTARLVDFYRKLIHG